MQAASGLVSRQIHPPSLHALQPSPLRETLSPAKTSPSFSGHQFQLPAKCPNQIAQRLPPISSISQLPANIGQSIRPGGPRQINGAVMWQQLAGEDWVALRDNRSDTRLRIFSGTANPQLSQEIASCMGLELGRVKVKRFADGEIYVQLQESVRGCDVFLVQPTCPPANENLMELLVMIDACRRASAKTITAVIPYFGYARADRKTQGRESIAAKLVANLITEAGANRVLACDLHSGQSMGYFDIPVDHVYGQPVILDYLASKMLSSNDLVVVSPDVGGVARARAFAKRLSDAPLAIVDKRRQSHNVAEVMNLIGDVKGKVAVMVDDMIDTAGTIAKGAALLHEEGASEVYACCTHAVFSPPAIERLSSGLFQEVIVTNTIPLTEDKLFPQLTVLSVANLLGETIWRVHDDTSLSSEQHPAAAGMDID
ncbi:hypothetical protein CLOM_g22586 [Closterium sp. NIES-68]|nr:hypothetical protein CLOM_g22586 [Closterium sp. NIES-68]GJP79393.1 hypothetical protein CLOP_g9627 [Closterium sp. NIES-67]